MSQVADKDWYQSVSESKSLTLRCPFATVDRCPRYYQSISLFSSTGGTVLSSEEDERLLEKWKISELWPRIAEHETSVGHSGEKLLSISNFCPEVTNDRYGYFCTALGAYADEIDSGMAQQRLSEEGISGNDPRWQWAHAKREHFSECTLYSLLSHPINEPKKGEPTTEQNSKPWWRTHIMQIVVAVVGAFATAVFAFLFS